MALVTTDDKHYKAIADKLRERNYDSAATYSPEKMPQAIENVYVKGVDIGYEYGHTEGYNKGEADGAKSEYDRFWNAFQQNGNRTAYQYAFAGAGWNTDAFKPKYDMKPTRVDYMFANWVNTASFDLTAALQASGVKLDTSKCTNFSNFLRYNSPARIPEIDTRAASSLDSMFTNASVVTVDKLILTSDGSQTLKNTIYLCPSLENIVIEGVIGYDTFSVQWSTKLSHDSIVSIISALSTTTSGYKVTLSKTAVNKAFEQIEGAADGVDSAEWQDLIATRSNWTIALI